MKKLLACILLVSLIVSIVPSAAFAHTADHPLVTELIAGQHTDAGEVLVWNDDSALHVVYQSDWPITETHLYVGTEPPAKTAPGRFPYSGQLEYTIPLGDIPAAVGDTIYIAAHAVVNTPTLFNVDLNLPVSTATIHHTYPGNLSYFVTLVTNGDGLNGTYDGWCIDLDAEVTADFPTWVPPYYGGGTYPADVYSSYEPLPAGLIEYPENLDLVNYIINQAIKNNWVSNGTYSISDIQAAIWYLLDDSPIEIDPRDPPNNTAGDLPLLPHPDWDKVNEIIGIAQAHDGFEPSCGDWLAVILVPHNEDGSIAQPTIIPIPIECGSETGWAFATEGSTPFDKKWGWSFTYTVQ